jgi:predicted transcriptional regulator
MGKKRDRLKIIYDILKAIHDRNDRILHTHILYKSNLSYGMLQQYLDELMFNDLVVERRHRDKKSYGLTDKGFTYLNKYNAVTQFARNFGLESEEEAAYNI